MADKDEEEPSKIPPEIHSMIEKAKQDGSYSKVRAALKRESASLIEVANNTFKQLCRTLDSEQNKLVELEERRKKLQEEMAILKAEIEKEKESCRADLDSARNNDGLEDIESLDISNEVELEEGQMVTYYEESSLENSQHSVKITLTESTDNLSLNEDNNGN